MELLVEAGIAGMKDEGEGMKELMDEAHELSAILTTCVKNVKGKSRPR